MRDRGGEVKGFAQRRIDRNAWEIALWDKDRQTSYTIEFKSHKVDNEDIQIETTLILDDPNQMEILKSLAEALYQIGILPGTATEAELKATKYHLEDMRKMVFK